MRKQGNRGKKIQGLTATKFMDYKSHEAKEGAGEGEPTEPPLVEQRDWVSDGDGGGGDARVFPIAEANHQQGVDDGRRESRGECGGSVERRASMEPPTTEQHD